MVSIHFPDALPTAPAGQGLLGDTKAGIEHVIPHPHHEMQASDKCRTQIST